MRENFLDTALKGMPVEGPLVDGILKHSGIVKTVLAGLREQGVVAGSWAEVLSITLLVIDLIQTLGPKVQEIIEAVKKALGQ